MKNLYDILGVSQKATPGEIKKAYNKLLRKYPPEKEEDKYKEIREAYDTLRDDELRKNYDAYFNYGDEIKKLQNEANNMIENKQYNQAEKALKKILILAPEILEVKKQLSEVFFLENKYQESLLQLNELIEISPKPSTDYHLRRGHTYLKMNNRDMAEKDFLKAYKLDYQNFDAITSIVNFYVNNNNIDKAIHFLEKEIYRDNTLDFDDFFCLSKLIEVYVIKNDEYNLKKVIEKIEKIAPSDEETKAYMSWKLAKLAFTIAMAAYGKLAAKVMDLAKKLTPDNKELDEVSKQIHLYELTQKMMEDDRIEYQPIKGPIFYYMHGHAVEKEEREININTILKDLDTIDVQILNIIDESLSNLEYYYHELYNQQKELYEELYKLLDEQLEVADEFLLFIGDSCIIHPLKLCIVAIEFKKDDELKKALEALGRSTTSSVKTSMDSFNMYPRLRKRYYNFISIIEKTLKNNFKENLNESLTSLNKSLEGCYIATAVYGDYEAPEVLVLRRFRDKFLKRFILGRIFIKIYYTLSPGLAKKLKKDSKITKNIKKVLDRFVNKIKNKY